MRPDQAMENAFGKEFVQDTKLAKLYMFIIGYGSRCADRAEQAAREQCAKEIESLANEIDNTGDAAFLALKIRALNQSKGLS